MFASDVKAVRPTLSSLSLFLLLLAPTFLPPPPRPSFRFPTSLLHPTYPLLPLLAARFPFETAIGVNGQVWIRAATLTQTIALGRAIKEVDEGRIGAEAVGEWVDGLEGVLAE